MKLLLVLATLLAAISPCRADEEDLLDGTLLKAMEIIHYYLNYELDVFVNGQGNTTIARQCRGSGDDNKCTFDEFINYVRTGTASQSPSYYEFDSGFSLVIGDTYNIIVAVQNAHTGGNEEINRIIKGRQTAVGLFDDLARIADANYKAPMTDDRRARVRSLNFSISVTLRGVASYATMMNKTGMLDRLRGIRDITWREARIENEFNRDGYRKVDWRATVFANSALGNRNSRIFQNVADELRKYTGMTAYREAASIAGKAQLTVRSCH